MPFDNTEVSDDLAIVARMQELLGTPDRWIKYALRHGNAYCLLGAYDMAANVKQRWGIQERLTAAPKVWEAMWEESASRGYPRKSPTDNGFGIAIFNNEQSTTHADIQDFLACVSRRISGTIASHQDPLRETVK